MAQTSELNHFTATPAIPSKPFSMFLHAFLQNDRSVDRGSNLVIRMHAVMQWALPGFVSICLVVSPLHCVLFISFLTISNCCFHSPDTPSYTIQCYYIFCFYQIEILLEKAELNDTINKIQFVLLCVPSGRFCSLGICVLCVHCSRECVHELVLATQHVQ